MNASNVLYSEMSSSANASLFRWIVFSPYKKRKHPSIDAQKHPWTARWYSCYVCSVWFSQWILYGHQKEIPLLPINTASNIHEKALWRYIITSRIISSLAIDNMRSSLDREANLSSVLKKSSISSMVSLGHRIFSFVLSSFSPLLGLPLLRSTIRPESGSSYIST